VQRDTPSMSWQEYDNSRVPLRVRPLVPWSRKSSNSRCSKVGKTNRRKKGGYQNYLEFWVHARFLFTGQHYSVGRKDPCRLVIRSHGYLAWGRLGTLFFTPIRMKLLWNGLGSPSYLSGGKIRTKKRKS
jgi:hypothetical protein